MFAAFPEDNSENHEGICSIYPPDRSNGLENRQSSVETTGMLSIRIARGRSLPLGATALADGVNFALLCRHGTAVTLVLYDLEHDEPQAELPLHPRRNRTGDHWHILVSGLPALFRYGWRVD